MLSDNPHRDKITGSKRRDIMLIALEKESGFDILFKCINNYTTFLLALHKHHIKGSTFINNITSFDPSKS